MKFKYLLIFVIVLGFIGHLTGCANNENSASVVDLAIVIGYHANAPTPALQSSTVSEAIMNSTVTYGSVCVVVNDGAPYVVADYDISAPQKNLSASKQNEIAQAQASQIVSVLTNARASTPEVDTLSAITLAARSLEDSQGTKYILVIDSGLSTCGYIDFTQNLLRADSQTIIEYLESSQALPSLDDISVVWVGLGDVAGAQDHLTPSNLETLESIWGEVLYAAGANSVEFASDLPGSLPADTQELPYVTPVEIVQDMPIVIDVSTINFNAPLILDEEKILFLPDTATFADYDVAIETLQPIAEYMMSSPDFRLLLAGTTATAGSNESCKTFSKTRADAVKDLLISMGINEEQIAGTVGLGYDHKYHIPDIGADGHLNSNAPANRSVILFDAASEAASEIIASYSF